MVLKEVFFIFLVVMLGSYLTPVEGACQSMDAAWDTDRGPLVTQPSKSDPSKVMLNWSNIIKNQRCVDEYSVWVWRTGTPKERGRKLPIPGSDAVSFIVEVEACVDYTFSVEFLEKNTLWAPTTRESTSSHFKTEAIPMLKSRDKSLFTVGYFFDASKGLHDLSKISIKFPKKIIEHANCIKHLEIKGHVDMTPSAFNASAGVLSKMSGKPKKEKKSKTAFNATMNATLAEIRAFNVESMYPDHVHDHGWHGRQGFVIEQPTTTTPPPGKKKSKRAAGLFSKSSTTTTTVKPALAAHQPPPLTATIPPPFINDIIEAVVEGAEPCKPYIFNIKVVSPRSAVMGEIEGLHLPSLNNILDYHPPSLKSLFQIDMVGGQPNIKWQSGLGVPAACLPSFFEAVDLHMARLEDDISYHLNQEYDTKTHVRYFNTQLDVSQKATLTQLGCKCNSSIIRLTTTDQITKSKIPHLLGDFHFDSDHQGKPYYRMPSKHEDLIPDFLVPPSPSSPQPHHSTGHNQPGYPQQTRVKRFIGKVPGSPTGSNTQNPYNNPPSYPPPPTPSGGTTANWYFPTPAPTIRPNPSVATLPPYGSTKSPAPPPSPPAGPPPISTPMKMAYFLFWDPLEKNWLISNVLGGAQPWVKSSKNPPVVCPADPGNAKLWTYEDRGRTSQWLTDATLKFECVV